MARKKKTDAEIVASEQSEMPAESIEQPAAAAEAPALEQAPAAAEAAALEQAPGALEAAAVARAAVEKASVAEETAPEASGSRDLVPYKPSLQEEEIAARQRLAAAESLVDTHMLIAGGAGLLPMPGVDLAAMSASQLWLLRRLSQLYNVPFTEDLARKLVASLLAGFIPLQLAGPASSAVKWIPLVGPLLGGVALVAIGGATTYAIGRAFVLHFETGGTLLTFEPQRVRAYFEAEYNRRVAAVLTAQR